MEYSSNLKYTSEHEWVEVIEGETSDDGRPVAKVGITYFAQSELGDLVYVEVDTVGDVVAKDEIFGTVEAVKTTSDLFMPVAGKVLEFNSVIDADGDDNPGIINESPHDKGWIIKIELQDIKDLDDLMDADAYMAEIKINFFKKRAAYTPKMI